MGDTTRNSEFGRDHATATAVVRTYGTKPRNPRSHKQGLKNNPGASTRRVDFSGKQLLMVIPGPRTISDHCRRQIAPQTFRIRGSSRIDHHYERF